MIKCYECISEQEVQNLEQMKAKMPHDFILKSSKYLCFAAVVLLLIYCKPNEQGLSHPLATENAQFAVAIADSFKSQKIINKDPNKDSIGQTFTQPVSVSQEDFRAGNKLIYYLPITIRNDTGRRIKGVVLERSGKGLDRPIRIRKFQVIIMPNKSVKMRLTLRDLDILEEDLYQTNNLNSRHFIHIIASQVIFSNGEIKTLVKNTRN